LGVLRGVFGAAEFGERMEPVCRRVGSGKTGALAQTTGLDARSAASRAKGKIQRVRKPIQLFL
jgi:hypothetical protein